jgi:hypothetical protein
VQKSANDFFRGYRYYVEVSVPHDDCTASPFVGGPWATPDRLA